MSNSVGGVATASLRPQRVLVWDARGGERLVDPSGLSPKSDPVAADAFGNATKVDSFLRDSFGRDGWDGKGAPLQVVVHAPNPDNPAIAHNNAYWDVDRRKVYLGDGDGTITNPLGGSLDVLTHEVVHAVVDSEVNLRYVGQQGGVNESFADVLASVADPDDWQIGEDVFTPGRAGDAVRDLANPRFAHTRMIPPGADIEVHDLSGVPSLAAVKVAEKIGRNEMGRIWYTALTEHLDSRSGYAGAARATLDAAKQLHGRESEQFAAVRDAWKGVGVNPRYKG